MCSGSASVFVVQAGSPEDASAANHLLPLVYDELKVLARAYLRRTTLLHALEPAALVHEAYLRLAHHSPANWKGRTHVLAVGARAMRQVLLDSVRYQGRKKRWGGCLRVALAQTTAAYQKPSESVLAVHEALKKLAEKDPRKAEIVELRFFRGLNVGEVARLLGCSKRVVEQEWTFIRAWLRRELSAGPT